MLIVLAIGFFIYREMRISHVVKALGETARATASVMLVIMASAALRWICSTANMLVSQWRILSTSLTENKYMFLLIINILLLTLGMFLEGNAILLILVPLLKPVVEHFGIRSGAFWHHHDLQPVDWRIHATGRYRDAAGM